MVISKSLVAEMFFSIGIVFLLQNVHVDGNLKIYVDNLSHGMPSVCLSPS